MKHLLLFVFSFVFSTGLLSQNVGINSTASVPNPAAVLDINASPDSNQGVLIPRMTDAQRQILSSPATGLLIYNTTYNTLYLYNGSGWQQIDTSGASYDSATGTTNGIGIAINTNGNPPNQSALLDVSSTTKGMLIPRTLPGSVTAITGLIIYNTTTNALDFYNGTAWVTPCQSLVDNIHGSGASTAGIAINSTGLTADPSAMLDISSATQGLLIPRLTSTRRDAVPSPAIGLLIYNITDETIEYWTGKAWELLSSPVTSTSAIASPNPICAGSNLSLTGTASGSIAWSWAGPNGFTSTLQNPTITGVTAFAAGTYSFTASNVCGAATPATTAAVTVNALAPASVSIAASANPDCSGTSVVYTATPTNGGTGPSYQWYVNTVAVGTNSSSYSYTPADNDQIDVVMTVGTGLTCPSGSPATSNTITETVDPLTLVSVSIAASANPDCSGTSVVYTATPTNGGTGPSYQWYVNTVAVGTNSSSYSYTPADNDQIDVVMTAGTGLTCPSGSPATSNTITETVDPLTLVSVSIGASANPDCSGTSVVYTATPTNGGTGPSYQWYVNTVAVGTNSSSYSYTPADNDQIYVVMTAGTGLTCPSGSPATSNTITETVDPLTLVSVSIGASANPDCSGTSVVYTATPTNGGTGPSYQWYVNTVAVGTNSSSYSYTPADNDQIDVVMTAGTGLTCPSGSPATSNTITETVDPLTLVSVSIGASANPDCSGTSVVYTATPTNGGTGPSYQWYVNTVAVGTNSSSYSYTPADNDQIYVVMTAGTGLTCPSGSPATSNTITETVDPLTPVSVSIAASANPVCNGTSVVYTATPTNGGTGPSYQWYVNTVAVGTNSSSYSYTPADNDQIDVVMTAGTGLTCPSGSPATSNTITETVDPLAAVSVSIAASANPDCSGTSVVYTATPTNGGTGPSYQWYVNTVAVGTNSSSYSYTPADNDQIDVVMTAGTGLTCPSGSPATSNTITETVDPLAAVSVSIGASANPDCSGTSIVYTATPTNGGTGPSYQWYVNSVAVGTNSSTYSYTPANNDQIKVVMTAGTGLTCPSGSPATSNTITETVDPLAAVSVSIGASANPDCSGTSIVYTATPTNGGTGPSYQWYVNSVAVGTNSSTYSYTPANNDQIKVVMTAGTGLTCPSGSPATSNTITETVDPLAAVSVSIGASVNPVCSGSSVVFTATPTNGGSSPSYQWYLNGGAVGTNSATYTNAALTNGNTIYCVMTSNATCPSGSPATSNTITETVTSIPHGTHTYAATGGSTSWTVPTCVTTVTIIAAGAEGGTGWSGGVGGSEDVTGGSGAIIKTTIAVTGGETIDIAVGVASSECGWSGGGGGGSFVWENGQTVPLVIGGGGGGGGELGHTGCNGSTTTSANNCEGLTHEGGCWAGIVTGYGGNAGSGNDACTGTQDNGGGGGAGWYTDGYGSIFINAGSTAGETQPGATQPYRGTGGRCRTSGFGGGSGGDFDGTCPTDGSGTGGGGDGGYGGGGGGGNASNFWNCGGGGGGGGYTGGDGGNGVDNTTDEFGGGGGGSFLNGGSYQGLNAADGYVTITW